MKSLLILVVTFTLTGSFVSCHKNTEIPEQSVSIAGSWELRQVSGGLAGTIDYAAGNGNILKFTDSAYQKFTNSQLVASGDYVIVPDSTVTQSVCLIFPADQFIKRIVYDSNYTGNKQFLQLSADTLKVVAGNFCVDGGLLKIYKKQ
jgi:hypothetical protein